jgi:DNA mismatch repair ATPase MutL
VLEHRVASELATGKLVAQPLLFPKRLEVSAAQIALLEAHATLLERLGFELRVAGPRAVTIHALGRSFASGSAELVAAATLEGLMHGVADEAKILARVCELVARGGFSVAAEPLVREWREAIGDTDPRDTSEVIEWLSLSELRGKLSS